MEKGDILEVWYKDDKQVTRHKTLKFISVKNGLLEFTNTQNGKKEIIPVHNLIRMEGSGCFF